MPGLLPPLRLIGAQILRDGVFQDRSIAIAEGRITKGPLPAIDLSGYLILPGAIDLMAAQPASKLGHADTDWVIDEADRRGASQGVTTQYLHQGWSWETVQDSPAAAEAMIASCDRHAMQAMTDLRILLRVEHVLAPDTDPLLSIIRRFGLDFVMLSDRAQQLSATSDANQQAFALAAESLSKTPDALALTLDNVLAAATNVPRALCYLTEQFDHLGVIYGSFEDRTGEDRERHSMIGAGICLGPQTYRAAAAAWAVCDPVILSARELETQIKTKTLEPSLLPRYSGIVSDGAEASLADLVLYLDQAGLLPLAQAWDLISKRPAEILRLTDRGQLNIGQRADLTIVNAETRKVEATISSGRLAFLSGAAAARFVGRHTQSLLAAE